MPDLIQKVEADVKSVKMQVMGSSNFGPVAQFFTIFQGRTTTFAILFALEGIFLLGLAAYGFFHHLDLNGLAAIIMSMAAFNGLIATVMAAHSTKEDWMAVKQQQVDIQAAQTQVNQRPQ